MKLYGAPCLESCRQEINKRMDYFSSCCIVSISSYRDGCRFPSSGTSTAHNGKGRQIHSLLWLAFNFIYFYITFCFFLIKKINVCLFSNKNLARGKRGGKINIILNILFHLEIISFLFFGIYLSRFTYIYPYVTGFCFDFLQYGIIQNIFF